MTPFFLLRNKKSYKTPRISRLYLQLRSRFAVLFFLLILLPFIFFMFASYLHAKDTLEKNTCEMNTNNLRQLGKSMETLVGELVSTADAAAGDPGASSDVKGAVSGHIAPGLSGSLAGAYLFDGGKITAYYVRDGYTAIFSNPSAQQWYKNAVKAPLSTTVYGTNQRFYSGGKSAMVFSVARTMGNGKNGASPAVLLLDFDYSLIEQTIMPDIKTNTGEIRILADQNNIVMCSPVASALTIALDAEISGRLGIQKEGFAELDSGSEKYYATFVRTQYPDNWTLISLIPTGSILNRLTPFNNTFATVCLLLIPVVLILYFVTSLMLLNPINELTAVISGYERSTSASRLPLQDYEHEHPASDNSGSSSEIDYLINKVYDIRLKQKEAELNSLQNQINPHFLYNTLESIRGAALYNGIHEIAAMSKALSLLFRYSISEKALVSIREELQHLENYMSIQNFRYENRFELVCNIPPELYSYQILKLTLQPLIENSIKHGLEMKLGKGIIKIDILSMDKNIRIEISDNGLGMPVRKIEELNRSLARDEFYKTGIENNDSSGTGIGVKNVNSRIKLYFGEQYGLKFKEAAMGTIVEMVLPAVKDI